MKKTLLALISLVWIGSAQANPTAADFELKTAQNLYNLCTISNSDPARERAVYLCVGYIDGALDLFLTLVRIGRLVPKTCLPEAVTRIDVAQTFIAWGKANSSRLNQATIDGLSEAVQAKWPCPKK